MRLFAFKTKILNKIILYWPIHFEKKYILYGTYLKPSTRCLKLHTLKYNIQIQFSVTFVRVSKAFRMPVLPFASMKINFSDKRIENF